MARVTRVEDDRHLAALELADECGQLVVGDEAEHVHAGDDGVGGDDRLVEPIGLVFAVVEREVAVTGEVEQRLIARLRALDEPGLDGLEDRAARRIGIEQRLHAIFGDAVVRLDDPRHRLDVAAAGAREIDPVVLIVVDADQERAVGSEGGLTHAKLQRRAAAARRT